ncbi:hypothetical protein BU24DRAFT_281925 [Aaosphaeria arxii CBS 175.79]|uniref:Uncharacterized protein n=1 Tax=Aaosphaeria arxii CBS 175.79 TaxID=1450172 RepID=A0A6A5XF60_9PLEO|nr:uncharacterized protein BU24DRAFT_281925 [Aaosphaeria arxii CBS 175.79]KAF2011486.1 hypothetical protein BU24DRAFT_281925 [Aaosphaeria arxii CBS 175.79]
MSNLPTRNSSPHSRPTSRRGRPNWFDKINIVKKFSPSRSSRTKIRPKSTPLEPWQEWQSRARSAFQRSADTRQSESMATSRLEDTGDGRHKKIAARPRRPIVVGSGVNLINLNRAATSGSHNSSRESRKSHEEKEDEYARALARLHTANDSLYKDEDKNRTTKRISPFEALRRIEIKQQFSRFPTSPSALRFSRVTSPSSPTRSDKLRLHDAFETKYVRKSEVSTHLEALASGTPHPYSGTPLAEGPSRSNLKAPRHGGPDTFDTVFYSHRTRSRSRDPRSRTAPPAPRRRSSTPRVLNIVLPSQPDRDFGSGSISTLASSVADFFIPGASHRVGRLSPISPNIPVADSMHAHGNVMVDSEGRPINVLLRLKDPSADQHHNISSDIECTTGRAVTFDLEDFEPVSPPPPPPPPGSRSTRHTIPEERESLEIPRLRGGAAIQGRSIHILTTAEVDPSRAPRLRGGGNIITRPSRPQPANPEPPLIPDRRRLGNEDTLPPGIFWLAGGVGEPMTVAQWNRQKPSHRMGGLVGTAIHGRRAGMPYERGRTEFRDGVRADQRHRNGGDHVGEGQEGRGYGAAASGPALGAMPQIQHPNAAAGNEGPGPHGQHADRGVDGGSG